MEKQCRENGNAVSETEKLVFTEPTLEVHEELLEITGQFAGTFSV